MCSAMAPYRIGATMAPVVAMALFQAKTVAVERPPMSVTTPQVVVRLQSEKNFTKNSIVQKRYGLSYQISAVSSRTAAMPLPARPTATRAFRRSPRRRIMKSLSQPPHAPPQAPPSSGRAE